MSKLIPWETPFGMAFYPSVTASFVKQFDVPDLLNVVVIPGGVGEYPRFLINFEEVLVFSCFDEACAPERDWKNAEIVESKTCSWQWVDSPWIRSYAGCNYDADGNPYPLCHYLIFGGDNIVEVLARKTPSIEEINEGHHISADFRF